MLKYGRGQVWYMAPVDQGQSLIAKSRPHLIISSNEANYENKVVTALPLTHGKGSGFINPYGVLKIDNSIVLINQVRTIPIINISGYIGILTETQMGLIDAAIKKFLFGEAYDIKLVLEEYDADYNRHNNSQELVTTQNETKENNNKSEEVAEKNGGEITNKDEVKVKRAKGLAFSNLKSILIKNEKDKIDFCSQVESKGYTQFCKEIGIGYPTCRRLYKELCIELDRPEKSKSFFLTKKGREPIYKKYTDSQLITMYNASGIGMLSVKLDISESYTWKLVAAAAKRLGISKPKKIFSRKSEEVIFPIIDKKKEILDAYKEFGPEYCASKFNMSVDDIKIIVNK